MFLRCSIEVQEADVRELELRQLTESININMRALKLISLRDAAASGNARIMLSINID